jgi:hypothetical protein
MALRTVHVKIRQNNQVIDSGDLFLDPNDDVQVRGALLDALRKLGEDPAPRHRIEIYKRRGGEFIRELRAA